MLTEKTLRAYKRKELTKSGERALTFNEACGSFVHRFTMEHVPDWALKPMTNKQFYAPQYRTDREWYDNTKFAGEKEYLSRSYCHSENMSWPLGKMLEKVYEVK